MIIFFGARTKVISPEFLLEEVCSKCNYKNLFLTFVQSYIHIFWIPFIPLNKRSVVYCKACGRKLKNKEIPSKFTSFINSQKAAIKTPAYYFSGLVIAALGLLVLMFV